MGLSTRFRTFLELCDPIRAGADTPQMKQQRKPLPRGIQPGWPEKTRAPVSCISTKQNSNCFKCRKTVAGAAVFRHSYCCTVCQFKLMLFARWKMVNIVSIIIIRIPALLALKIHPSIHFSSRPTWTEKECCDHVGKLVVYPNIFVPRYSMS